MEEMQLLKAETPTLYSVYACAACSEIDKENGKLLVKDLFKSLIQKRNRIFNKKTPPVSCVSYEDYCDMLEHDENSDHDVEITELLKTGIFFPNHPIIRKIDDIRISDETFDCSKIYKKPNKLGAGVLLFFCVEHNTCIGLIILGKSESPKIINEILMTRFKIMPELVLYDNACNLQEFVLNRNPQFFQKTRFLVDGFHYSSHKNCCNAYNASDYPEITVNLNTSLVEQKNAQLRFMKRTAPLLKFNTFAMKLIYSVLNINKLS